MPEFVYVSPEMKRMSVQDIRLKVDETYSKWAKLKRFLDDYVLTHIYWYRQAPGYRAGTRFAADHDRRILLSFSGITWCAPCMMLEAVFRDDLFEAWALEEELVLINVDYDPDTFTAEDLALFSEFNIQTNLTPEGHYGLPMVFGLAPDGSVLGGVEGYPEGGVIEWIELFETALG